MSGKRLILAVAAFAGLGLAFAVPSVKADGVEYQAANLGGNEWQYTYTLTGAALSANQAFSVYFDPTLTSNVNDTSTDFTNPSSIAATEWLTLAFSGDPVLMSEGVFTALALTNGADPTTDSFTVTFLYTGLGAPGSQVFSIDQFDAAGNLISNLQTGETTPLAGATVPEPGTGVLLGVGLLALGRKVRARWPGRTTTHT
jgi:hypothetical protein